MDEFLDHKLKRLADEILAGCDEDNRLDRIGEMFLPSRSKIVALLDLIRQLLFPGFFGGKKLTRESVPLHVGHLLMEIADELSDEIYHCFCAHQRCELCDDVAPCRRRAGQLAVQFLEQVPAIREMLAMDAQSAYDGDPAAKSIDEVVYCYPGYYAITVYRITHVLERLGVPLMPRIMAEYAHHATGTDIHPGARIGKRFFIDHATGVVIGETTVIGDNVKIYQGVTLGALSFPKDERGRVIRGQKRHPTIEDNVTIYANATILGGDTVIGEGVTVAGNTFVAESVTSKSVVAMEKPRLKVRSKRTSPPRKEKGH
jgi:serine O-acetyltransferase